MDMLARKVWKEAPTAPLAGHLPVGDAVACPACLETHDRARLAAALMVCPGCGHHFRLAARERLRLLLDPHTFREWDAELSSADPLGFVDEQPYPARVEAARRRTGERDAVVTGEGSVQGVAIAIGVFEFGFMGGSMGSVVGEKVARLFDRARTLALPVVAVTASGGARMQEGTLSLMQMAKVTVAIEEFRRRRLPYVALLTDPTTGGVAASLASLGDVLIAEPRAHIGFAGPRVIEETIRTSVPRGFQQAERLLERGMLDAVVPRRELRAWLGSILRILRGRTATRAG